MSFVVSFVLACTTILATFMLQLCDDSPKSNGSIICAISFFAILFALIFVDYNKKFSISKTTCNILIVLVVLLQASALLHSREDFLAFSIANILSSLQVILFFQQKTIRKCYQILSISFVEVAVGCVFQRSALFIAALPIYSILSLTVFSLLFICGEQKFYAERVILKKRFTGNKNLAMITAEEREHPKTTTVFHNRIDNISAYQYGRESNFIKETHFFRRSSSFPVKFELEYFRRFIFAALGAFLFASLFFFLFPRMDQMGFGAIQFDPVNWNNVREGRITKTGFKPSIELGDLGPTVDSHAVVMSVKVKNVLTVNENSTLNSNFPIYFRGVALANYKDHIWSDIKVSDSYNNAKDLFEKIKKSGVIDPREIITDKILNSDQIHKESQFSRKHSSFGDIRSNHPRQNPYSLNLPSSELIENEFITRPTFFRQPPVPLPNGQLFNAHNLEENQYETQLLSYCQNQKDELLFDTRSQLISMRILLNHLDTPIVFSTYPFFVVKTTVSLETNRSLGIQITRDAKSNSDANEFWFLTTCFQNGIQMSLIPNQERVYPYIDQYLALDGKTFPLLIEKARLWDRESGIPQNDFVSRAKNIETRLRDYREYRYCRTGTPRNPDIDPLEDFISEHKEGHCEYFAGALALMLRAIGIPSRVIVGYVTYPSNDDSSIIVRQSDAHSWVEAYIPSEKLPSPGSKNASLFAGAVLDKEGKNNIPENTKVWVKDGAWLRLDATPFVDRNAERPSRLTVGFYNWSHFFQTFGNDFIMNFNGSRQMQSIYRPLFKVWKNILINLIQIKKFFRKSSLFIKNIFDDFHRFLKGEWTSEIIIRFFLILTVTTILISFSWRIGKKISTKVKETFNLAREHKKRKNITETYDELSADLYRKIEAFLMKRLQTVRDPSETSWEFIERCFEISKYTTPSPSQSQQSLPSQNISRVDKETAVSLSDETQEKLKLLVKRYYHAQFGESVMPLSEYKQWTEVLRSIPTE